VADVTTYAFRTLAGDLFLSAPESARPTPVHAQIAEAQRQVERAGEAASVRRRVRGAELVTVHGNPPPYRGAKLSANAKKLIAAAEAAGFQVKALEFVDGAEIQGLHVKRRVGFRAEYVRGRAAAASWHEPYRYAIVRDDRPIKVNALTRTGLKGYRTAGMSETRLQLLGRPQGMKITVTQLLERIEQ